jgi:hypothetical protein
MLMIGDFDNDMMMISLQKIRSINQTDSEAPEAKYTGGGASRDSLGEWGQPSRRLYCESPEWHEKREEESPRRCKSHPNARQDEQGKSIESRRSSSCSQYFALLGY